MAFKTFTAGSVLTAAEVNDYLMKQAVIVCTSSTRPASPIEGMTIYETDTDKFLTYDGASWRPVQNPRMHGVTAAKNGTAPAVATGQFQVQAGTTVATTNGSGDFTVTFPVAFPAGVMAVYALNGDAATATFTVHVISVSTTAAVLRLYGTTWAGLASVSVRVDWIAVGF